MENDYVIIQASIKKEVKAFIESLGFGVSAMTRKILTDYYEYKKVSKSDPFHIEGED